MHSIVRAFLPITAFAAMALCQGCGGGGESAQPQPTNNVPPAAPPVSTTPTISGVPPARIRVGQEYAYQPTTINAGAAPKFTATNLPPWMKLDAANGRISGRPALSDVGEYDGISIAAADATGRETRTDEFKVEVQGPANGVAELVWGTPVSKVDGSPLDDLAGFRILYGRSEDDLDHSVLLMNPRLTSYQFTTLETGTWFFSIVGVNANGLEGPATPPAMKII